MLNGKQLYQLQCDKRTALLCSMLMHFVELIYVTYVKANVRKLSANGVTVCRNEM